MATGPSNTSNPTGTPNTKSASRPAHGEPPVQHTVEIKDADVFQSRMQSGFNWVEDNSKLFIAVLAILVIIGIAYAAVTGLRRHQERVAQDEFYKVEAPFLKKRDAFEKTKFKAFMPKDAEDKTPGEVATGDLGKDYGALLTGVESTAKTYAGTAAGSQAAILVAQTYLDYKNPDKAIEYAQIPAKSLPAGHTLAELSRVLWGNALATKGDCQQALDVWQKVLNEKNAAYLASDVNLRMGVCLEKLGQNDRAAEAYRAASKADSPSAQSAKGLLRALELKNPAVAQSAPAGTGLKLQEPGAKAP